ncbi:MAG TPA: pyridoxamine 5'-phosphate oxidase [Gemmataceae bacterium]|nr:pyridoxamine 5'-phosphate oxidase [Gemmataceae bacterium]
MSRLHETELHSNPFRQFQLWLDEAIAARLPQPLGMALATATVDGRPSVRMVLLRGLDERGFAFFTNYESRKARELEANPRAALVFYWAELDRQVRIEGTVERLSAEESDVYFRSRERGSRLGAWASPQSQVIASRDFLERRMEELTARYTEGDVPRPPYWGGYRLLPAVIEFWQGQPSRLHDRLRYRRCDRSSWLVERLAP